jgi:thiol-disulfide isomerase/thioredoxin
MIRQSSASEFDFRGFAINGVITGLQDGCKIFLIKLQNNDTVCVSIVRNSSFELRGKVENETEYYYLRIDSSSSTMQSEMLLLVNRELKLESSLTIWPKIKLVGSEPHDELLQIKKIWASEIDEGKKVEFAKEFIHSHRNSIYVPDLIRRLHIEFKVDEQKKMFDSLTEKAKKSYFGQLLASDLEIGLKRKYIKMGAKIPSFNIKTISGEVVSIYEIVKKSKYTLIDFWASWCKPCREETPNMKKVYESFKEKGFNIVGIAVSDKEEDWKKAIKEDQTNWTHTRDTSNITYKIFDLVGIPAFILLDSNGSLISVNCIGSQIRPFGPPIKGQELFNTIQLLVEKNKISSQREVEEENLFWFTKQKARPIEIGEKVPDIKLGEIINNPSKQHTRISDYYGKLLILDFWSTWCGICIALFPHMEKLQQKFGDKVAILPVGFDVTKEGTIKRFAKIRDSLSGSKMIPTAIQKPEDTLLIKMFPFSDLPTAIWIDSNGILIGITDHRAVTENNIAKVLSGEKVNFARKKLTKKDFNDDEKFIVDLGLKNSSGFVGFVDTLSSFMRMDVPKSNTQNYKWRWANSTIYSLYNSAYSLEIPELLSGFENKRIIVDPRVRNKFMSWKDSEGMDNWMYADFQKKNLFGYEILGEGIKSEAKMRKKMIHDLDSFFNIKSSVQERPVRCFALVRTSQKNIIKLSLTASSNLEGNEGRLAKMILTDYNSKSLLALLEGKIDTEYPLIDKTGVGPNFDLEFPTKQILTIKEAREILQPYGFDLIEITQTLKVLILQEQDWLN